jgi:hypothetical protein
MIDDDEEDGAAEGAEDEAVENEKEQPRRLCNGALRAADIECSRNG